MRSSVLIIAILCSGLGGRASAQNNTMTITNQSRPVMRALLQLSKQYGYVITYEEPILIYTDDLRDVTTQRHISRYSARKILIPHGGSLQLQLPAGSKIGEQGMDDLLQQLVEAWADSNQGGAHFAVEEDGATFHIVPTEVRDSDGNWQAVESILKKPISLPSQPRDKYQTFDAICRAISISAGPKVNCLPDGGLIVGPWQTAQYTVGANDEPAESVLTRAIAQIMGRSSWYLLYDPTTRSYFLNILRQPDTDTSATQRPAAPSGAPGPPPQLCKPCIATPPPHETLSP